MIDTPSIPLPKPPPHSFPIVGIGASAGGLAAFEAFFSGMPADRDPGMAFVLVQHLAPDHKSILSELVRHYTRMQVFEVQDGMVVQPNCAYIIPPNCDMAFLGGALHLLPPTVPRGHRLAIDYFFQSLADDQHERAIGIVLSGTGSDGTLGVRAIKNAGGMVMAQSIASSEFDGMPRSALATGLVDYALAPAEMPAQLMAYATQPRGMLPRISHLAVANSGVGLADTEGAGVMADDTVNLNANAEGALKRIFVLLRAQTRHDFSQYKPNTIYRRVERRLAVHQLASLDDYVKYLQQTPTEIDALFGDLLIGVTRLFRDTEAFAALEAQVIPALFASKPEGAAVRVWSAGCSTGEEAYSLAILLVERMQALNQTYLIQIFATDIDSRAIAVARAGRYPASIAGDISAERLARFFTLEAGGQFYRIHKSIRDLMVFSEQDIIKDPPFSRLDLISCRNLLIYLNATLQKRLIPLFHFALVPTGMLFLGSAEGLSELDGMFAAIDLRARLYRRTDDTTGAYRAAMNHFAPPIPSLSTLPFKPTVAATGVLPPSRGVPRAASLASLPLRELMEQALLRYIAPSSALVNADGDIVYLHGRTGNYLEPIAGVMGVQNILKMARDGLRTDLRKALRHTVSTQQTSLAPNLRVQTNSQDSWVNLSVHAVATAAPGAPDAPLYLVMLDEVPAPLALAVPHLAAGSGLLATNAPTDAPATLLVQAQAQVQTLTQALRTSDDDLQNTHDELTRANEDLKSSTDQMQSFNEVLQSTNEELETSKEELQSVNEELATVNTELQTKVTDLSHANNDMNNLLAGTGIGTVFVDFQLRILRFTPAASSIINLIASDVGRAVSHIASNLVGYSSLVADIKSVLNTLVPVECEVQNHEGLWYTLRIQPYRTLDNVIEGAVISFVNISKEVASRVALASANDLLRLAVVVRDAHDAITVQDLAGRTLAWNPGAARLYGWTEAQALQLNVRERIPPNQRAGALDKLASLSRSEVLEPYLTQRITATGAVLDVSIISTALLDDAGQMYAIATTERVKPLSTTGADA